MSIELTDATPVERAREILTPDALAFVQRLHEHFSPRRDELLLAREGRRVAAATAGRLAFLDETSHVREADWQVAEAPSALRDRRAEMTDLRLPPRWRSTHSTLARRYGWPTSKGCSPTRTRGCCPPSGSSPRCRWGSGQ